MKLLFLLLLLVGSSAFAQAPSVSSGYSGLDHINRIIAGTPGITTASVTGGVNATASGSVTVKTPAGLSIPVPTSVTGKAGTAAIAAGAAKIGLRVLPFVGTAIALNDIGTALAKEGWKVCPPPSFFCKPDWDQPLNDSYWYSSYYGVWSTGRPRAIDTCIAMIAVAYPSPSTNYPVPPFGAPYGAVLINGSTTGAYCWATRLPGPAGNSNYQNPGEYLQIGPAVQVGACAGQSLPAAVGCGVQEAAPPDIPGTELTLQQALDKQFAADAVLVKKMYDQQKLVEQQNPALPKLIPPASLALSIAAPAVSSPSTVVQTETFPNADGNGTSTKTVTQQATVTPTLVPAATGATVNPVSFPISTTTTTAVTNNVTNVTNTTTNISKSEALPQEAPEKLPTDYNREATQQEVLKELKAADMVTDGSNVDDKSPQRDIDLENAKGTVALDGISAQAQGIRGWLPNIPTAQCVNPTVPNQGGAMVEVPICGSVNLFSKFISGVLCVFALFGCVREVQAAAKS